MAGRRSAFSRASAHAGPWLVWWVASMLLWLLLTSTIDKAEAVVGVGAAAFAATAAEVIRANGVFGFRPRVRWLYRAWRIPARILTESVQAFVVLLLHVTGRKQARGTLRAVPFR